MKHLNLLFVLVLLSFAGIAQTSCPDILTKQLVRFATAPNCTGQVIISATNDRPSSKPVRVRVFIGSDNTGTPISESCFILPGNSTDTYTTPTFSYPCGATLTYSIIRYSASNGQCQGGECGPEITTTDPGGTLPINLKSFNGNRTGNNVSLNWNTEQEVNGAYFEIQRNTGSGFQSINKVNAKNAATGALYNFEDMNVAKAAVQYRLKLVDIDGSFKFSDIVSIKALSSVSEVSIFPNPAPQGTAKMRINDISDITNVQVYDLRGQVVKNIVVTGNNINLSDLQAGSYLIKMVNANTGGSETKKLIIVN